MGRLVVSEFMTLDGIVSDPGGADGTPRGGWALRFDRGAEGDAFKLDEVLAAAVLLLGRVTYEGFAAAWPGRSDEAGFADRMNGIPKHVVSTTLEEAAWSGSTVISGDVPDAVARLKREVEGDVLVAGSCRLARTLLDHGLVDELRLMIFPVVLGVGERLFADVSAPWALDVVECRPVGPAGVLLLVGRPAATSP